MALHSPDLADMRNILRMTSDGKLSDTLWEGLKKMVTP